jgi:multiple RNA-binding domain-containing protein 1
MAMKYSEANGEDDDGNDHEQEDAKKEEISKSRLFVRNLPFETTEEELDEYFSAYGKLVECHIPVDDQKRNKGFAFIQYASAVDALAARNQLDKVDFQGRLLHILPAKPAPKQTSGEENLTWKQKQELARKQQDTTNGDSKGWSASFIRGDAVVDNLAERLGLRKADFLGIKDNLSSGDAAVRLALGETQIIEENREYFRQNGVDMEALVSANGKEAQRSKTSMLVKNLPFDTSIEELSKLFQMGDESVKILLPPSRTIALVEYGHHSDAKKAFKRLAYRRFKHVPIYLEWAPLAARTEEGDKAMENNSYPATNTQIMPLSESIEDVDADVFDGTVSTIYIKNLNFASTEETLRQVFEKNVGAVRSVRIPQKVAPVKNGEEPQLMSMGYGFVELDSEGAVKKALQVLQGKLVDGHAWEVTVSSNKTTSKSKLTPSTKNPTKLVVRNVPFQATRSEILKLFGSFGQLRRVRLPKKFDGSHRGFAFVEFLTSKEAVAAMNALSRTHLYGRHLVLEWTTDEEDLDRLRAKATRDIEAPLPKNKRIKFT